MNMNPRHPTHLLQTELTFSACGWEHALFRFLYLDSFLVLRQGLSAQLWLPWNSLWRSGWPWTRRILPWSASRVLGSKEGNVMPSSLSGFLDLTECPHPGSTHVAANDRTSFVLYAWVAFLCAHAMLSLPTHASESWVPSLAWLLQAILRWGQQCRWHPGPLSDTEQQARYFGGYCRMMWFTWAQWHCDFSNPQTHNGFPFLCPCQCLSPRGNSSSFLSA